MDVQVLALAPLLVLSDSLIAFPGIPKKFLVLFKVSVLPELESISMGAKRNIC